MPTFTLELWRVLELYPETPQTYAAIGLDQYPIFDDEYREKLNKKIVNHYHNQEIGQETVSMWKFAMRRKMDEIMPFYNQLYETTKLEFDPLATIDIKTMSAANSTQTSTANSESESTSTGSSGSRAVQSNMPQNMLAGNKDYATAAADTTSQSNNGGTAKDASNATNNDSNTSSSETKGYQGIPSDLLMAYRSTLLNIDMLIIAELRELFMTIWNNGDEYTRRKGYPY